MNIQNQALHTIAETTFSEVPSINSREPAADLSSCTRTLNLCVVSPVINWRKTTVTTSSALLTLFVGSTQGYVCHDTDELSISIIQGDSSTEVLCL